MAIFCFTLAAVLVLMYARRQLRYARLAVFAMPAVVLLLFLAAPAARLIASAYRPAAQGMTLAFDAAADRQTPGSGEPQLFSGNVQMQLPIQLTGISSGQMLESPGARLTLRAADGFQWSSAYRQPQLGRIFPKADGSVTTERVALFLPERVYDRVRTGPVTVSLQLLFTRAAAGAPQHATVPTDGTFAAPDHGQCHVGAEDSSFTCRFAYRHSSVLRIESEVQDAPCEAPGAGPRITHTAVMGNLASGLTPDFDPIVTQGDFYARPRPQSIGFGSEEGQTRSRFLCPGAHVTFTAYSSIQKGSLTLTQPGVQLAQYVQHKHGKSRVVPLQ